MMRAKLLVVTAVGLSAAACSYTSTTTQATAPYPAYRAGSEQACLDYGFLAGTDAYNRCVVRESEARARGRMPVTYAVANLTADAQAACYSYGLTAGTPAYDRCVGREIDARRYRDQAYVAPAPYPATYYTTPVPAPGVYTTVTTYPAPTPTYAAPTPPAGQQAFRDEYGFRYDGQGNRIDSRGNIISPQSTSP
jgi:hypothetical protein